jgi:hypothetical protein
MLRITLARISFEYIFGLARTPVDSQLLTWLSLRDGPVAFRIDITIIGLEEFEIELGSDSSDRQVKHRIA